MTNTASTHLAESLTPSARTRLATQGYLSRYKGATLRTYTTSLTLLFRFLLAYRIDPLDAKSPHLELYMHEYLEEQRHISPASVNSHMTPVRGFYKYATIQEFIPRDPALGLLMPKAWPDEFKADWVKDPEIRAMLGVAERTDRPSDGALMALLLYMGLRISEALSIRVENFATVIDGYRALRFIGKGNKPATMPLPIPALQLLERAAAGRASGPLLLRESSSVHSLVGLPMTYRSARIALDRVARRAGIERKITPHMCRRGAITAGLQQGATMEKMQDFARHEDPRTTWKYDRSRQNLKAHAVHILAANWSGR